MDSVGDLNADGFDDILVGASGASPNGINGSGSTYVVFGGPGVGTTGALDLSALNGSNGFEINGFNVFGFAGLAASGTGDLNADGIDDLVLGSVNAAPNGVNQAGQSYVIFGGVGIGTGGSLSLASLNGSNGFTINGIDPLDQSGNSVSDAGDLNADGVDDLVIGAFFADPLGNSAAGEAYVIFGGSGLGAGGTLNLSSLSGTDGFVLNGIDANDTAGSSVSAAGDLNADGIDDLAIGATGADPNGNSAAGETYIVFGASGLGASGSFNLSSLTGTNGFTLNGINSGDFAGRSVSAAGDVNADGIDDLIVGADSADPNGNSEAGEAYVVFGAAGIGAGGFLNLSSLDGSNGFVLNGIDPGDSMGVSVSTAGDVDGDGIADLLMGANDADSNGSFFVGEAYVVFGASDLGASGSIELASLNGRDGYLLRGIDSQDLAGEAVSRAGDLNSDGIDDFLIGARQASPNGGFRAGETYVVFGSARIADWSSLGGGNFETATNWQGGLSPSSFFNVFLTPDFGGTITGPSGLFFMRALTLAAGTVGTTTLDLPLGSLLIVEDQIDLQTSGSVVGSGRLVFQGTPLTNEGTLGNAGDTLEILLSASSSRLDNQGLMTGSLLVDATATTNLSGGTVRVDAGDIVSLEGPGHEMLNQGIIHLFGGRLDVDANLTNDSGIIAGNGMLSAARLINAANASVGFNGESSVIGEVTNLGDIAILGAANLTFFDDVAQNGDLQIGEDSRAIVLGDFSGTGGTSGPGTLEVSGTLSPGSSPASVSFGGDVILSPQSATLLEFTGDQTGEFDQIISAGSLTLDGDLNLALLDAYVPPDGTSFVVMSAASVSGEFKNLPEGSAVDSLAGAEFFISYGPQQVVLTVPEPQAAIGLSMGIGLLGMLGRKRKRQSRPCPPRRSATTLALLTSAALMASSPALAATFFVNATADGGDISAGDGTCSTGNIVIISTSPPLFLPECTLRAAIEEANALTGLDEIKFSGNLPTVFGFVEFIPGTALPPIFDPIIIDGYSHPSYDLPNPAAPPIINLLGNNTPDGSYGLAFLPGSDGSILRGVSIARFPESGVLLSAFFADGPENIAIEGNYIGVSRLDIYFGNDRHGVEIQNADNNTIGQSCGLVVGCQGKRNLISGNEDSGIFVENSTGTKIAGNYIGIDSAGSSTLVPGAYLASNGEHGVFISEDSSNNSIGGIGSILLLGGGIVPAASGNLISGNALDGINVQGPFNTIVANTIGPNAAGTSYVGNSGNGITVGGDDNIIGGAGLRSNLISSNIGFGIYVDSDTGSDPSRLSILNNRVGVNASADAILVNLSDGLLLWGSDHEINDNIIGGNVGHGISDTSNGSVMLRNHIGTNENGDDLGNTEAGIRMSEGNQLIGGAGNGNIIGFNANGIVGGGSSYGNRIRGNYVGTNPAGDDIGNAGDGISNSGAEYEVGEFNGRLIGSANTIAFNGGNGITDTGYNTLIQGNYIGTNDVGADLGNGGAGILAETISGPNASIGATLTALGADIPGSGNTVAHNVQGIVVENTNGIPIRGNQLFKNGGHGIDLGGDGPTVNDRFDSDTGANNLQNMPTFNTALTFLDSGTGQLQIRFAVPSATANAAYPLTIDFYIYDPWLNDGDEASAHLGSASYTTANAESFVTTTLTPTPGSFIPNAFGDLFGGLRATATDANGNTSELTRLNVPVPEPETSALLPAGLLGLLALSRRERGGDFIK
ncbi:MAG: beta strand repeat-containing protein [Myxococcota bacterium]